MGCQHKVWLQHFRTSSSINYANISEDGREMSFGPCQLRNSGFSEVHFLKTFPGRAEPGNIQFPTGVRVIPALCPTLGITTILCRNWELQEVY